MKIKTAKRKPEGFTAIVSRKNLASKFWFRYKKKFNLGRNLANNVIPRTFHKFSKGQASAGMLQKRFKTVLEKIGLNQDDYTFHSCKRGRATTAIKQGLTLEQVTKLGRWKSKEMADLYNLSLIHI